MMAKRRTQSLTLSGEHARQALAVLIQEGKLAASEVKKALQRRDRLVRALRTSLAALEAGVVKVGRQFKDSPFALGRRAKTAKLATKRRKPRISAATRKMYQQQGRYMAAVRQLPKGDRAKVKAIREKSGVRAAIAAAKSRLAEQRFITRQPRSKDSDQPWKTNGKHRHYPARPNPRPDKHGGSGAGRQQGGSGVGREHG
jgi:DNA repair exonuclease SbcCD ATPase subunit